MGLFDRIKKALGVRPPPLPQRPGDAIPRPGLMNSLRQGDGFQVSQTNWMISGDELFRKFRFTNDRTGKVDEFGVSILVRVDHQDGLVSAARFQFKPAIGGPGRLQIALAPDSQEMALFVDARMLVDDYGDNVVVAEDHGQPRCLAALAKGEMTRLHISFTNGVDFVRWIANEGSYLRLLKILQDKVWRFDDLAKDAVAEDRREMIVTTNWEFDGWAVVRGFRFRNMRTKREDSLEISVVVQAGAEPGTLIHFLSFEIDPPISLRDRDVRVTLRTTDGSLESPTVVSHAELKNDDRTRIGLFQRPDVMKLLTVLEAGKAMLVKIEFPGGEVYLRELPNDDGYRRTLKGRQQAVLARERR